MTSAFALPALIVVGVLAYTAIMFRLHKAGLERCEGGRAHLWRGPYRCPPTPEPVEEVCERCCATRFVIYDGGLDERVVGYGVRKQI